jgi:LPS export ABC transporter protein LptC
VAFEGYSGALQDVSVTAARARVEPTTRVALLEQVRVELRQTERGQLRVEAPQGRFDLATDDFSLAGGVTGHTERDTRLTTREVHYDQAAGMLTSDAPVELVRNDMTLRAAGMEIDLEEQRMRLVGGVVARLRAE